MEEILNKKMKEKKLVDKSDNSDIEKKIATPATKAELKASKIKVWNF